MHVIPMRIQVRLLRKMRAIPDHYLRSLLRAGGEIVRAEVIRHVGARHVPGWDHTLCTCLSDRSPAIRRNAALSIGYAGNPVHKNLLMTHALKERCDTVRFQILWLAAFGRQPENLKKIVNQAT